MRKFLPLCVVLLAGCGDRPTADWVDQLRSKDATQRLHAIKALQNKRAEAATIVPVLSGALRDEDPFVRRDAARALGNFGPEARPAVPALLPLLRDRNAGVRKATATALAVIDPAQPVRRR